MKKTPLIRKAKLKPGKPLRKKGKKQRRWDPFDAQWRALIKASGECACKDAAGIECYGELRAMHIVKRRHMDFRWHPLNGLPGCMAHDDYFENRRQEFYRFVREKYPEHWAFVEPHIRKLEAA